MEKFKHLLPENGRQEFSSLVNKDRLVVRTWLQAGLDVGDSVAKTIASAVSVWRFSWLQSSGLPYEVQNIIQDLPFEGPSLLSD